MSYVWGFKKLENKLQNVLLVTVLDKICTISMVQVSR